MSADTILRIKKTNVEDLIKILSKVENISNVKETRKTSRDEFYSGFINFTWTSQDNETSERSLFFVEVSEDKEDLPFEEYSHLSLGFWGESVEILREVAKHTNGGVLVPSDCDTKLPIEIINGIDSTPLLTEEERVIFDSIDDKIENKWELLEIIKQNKKVISSYLKTL